MDQELFARFRKCAVEVLSVDGDQVVPEAKFGDDLDADSLDLVELVMALEEEFDIEVPEEELEGVETVGQAYDLVDAQALMSGAGRRVAVTGLGVVAPCGIGQGGVLGRACSARGSPAAPVVEHRRLGSDARTSTTRRRRAAPTGSSSSRSPRPPRRSSRPGDADVPTPAGSARSSPPASAGSTRSRSRSWSRLEKGERRVSPFLVPMMMANASGAAISMRYGLQGPNETICTACAASTHAIGYAARLIAWGIADAVVTGGAEAAGTPTAIAGFGNMTALSSSGHQPAVRRRSRRLRDGRGRRRVRARGVGAAPTPAAPRSIGEIARRRRATPTPTTSPLRRRAASVRSPACG